MEKPQSGRAGELVGAKHRLIRYLANPPLVS
jgi:hypothetical protein